MTWYAIRTNIKCEHKALGELRAAGFDAYLPEFKIERFNRKRRVPIISTLCLFPRYLFVNVTSDSGWRKVRACNGVEEVLPGRGRDPEPILEYTNKKTGEVTNPVEDLRDLQARLAFDDTDAARRRRGQTVKDTLEAMRKRLRDKRVLVKEGHFASFPGTIGSIESLERLTVLISIFGRDTPVELEFGQIEELAA